MKHLFARRICQAKESFIREILKVTKQPDIISFAGGLPNPQFFPVAEIAQATTNVLANHGQEVLQYNITEGYEPLRYYIAQRYQQRYGLPVSPAEILITNGSQQGLDLIGKVFLNPGDRVILERPAYLGAIQALGMYEPKFQPISLTETGLDCQALAETLHRQPAKLVYSVPNFQNPSGISYSAVRRDEVAQILSAYPLVVVEDDPYSELHFSGADLLPLKSRLPEQTILLGSFSKIISPGLRLGWLCAPSSMMKQLVIAKQAADIHANYLAQRIVYQYLQDNDLASHLTTIRQAYKRQCDRMIDMMMTYFPPEVRYTRPLGGMFIWLTLPAGLSAMTMFEQAIRAKVAFVPGLPFYIDGGGENSLRLNFSNSDETQIEVGMQRLAKIIKDSRTRL